MPAPLVSVVLPTRNRASGVPRAVDSVLTQTYGELELLVVDDGSTDGTEGVVRSYRDPRVRYLRKGPPHSAAAARNFGAEAARGSLLAFNDCGDAWLPEKLAAQVPVMQRMPDKVGMIYSSLIRVHADGLEQRVDSPVFDAGEPGTWRRALAMGVSGIYPQTAVLRAVVFRELGGFDEAFSCWEDLEFFMRLARRHRLQFVPGHFTRLHDDSRGVSRNLDAMFDAHRKIMARYAADLGDDARLLTPHYRAIGRRLIPSRHGAYAREALWKVIRSGLARPDDYAWLLLSYGGRSLFRALSRARRALWSLRGRAPALDAHGL